MSQRRSGSVSRFQGVIWGSCGILSGGGEGKGWTQDDVVHRISRGAAMNEEQKKIRQMVMELTEAMERHPPHHSAIAEIFEFLPGMEDGSFFDLPDDVQKGKLGWLNGAYFGRGERAMPLFESGVLRGDFDGEFHALLLRYWGHR